MSYTNFSFPLSYKEFPGAVFLIPCNLYRLKDKMSYFCQGISSINCSLCHTLIFFFSDEHENSSSYQVISREPPQNKDNYFVVYLGVATSQFAGLIASDGLTANGLRHSIFLTTIIEKSLIYDKFKNFILHKQKSGIKTRSI